MLNKKFENLRRWLCRIQRIEQNPLPLAYPSNLKTSLKIRQRINIEIAVFPNDEQPIIRFDFLGVLLPPDRRTRGIDGVRIRNRKKLMKFNFAPSVKHFVFVVGFP